MLTTLIEKVSDRLCLKSNTQLSIISILAVTGPVIILIAGIWAAMGLPIVNIGALYLVNKLEPELQPRVSTKIILWASLILQLSLAGLIVYDIGLNF